MVVRKRVRRISIRIAEDGRVCLTVPKWWSTLREGEAFLRSKWSWIQKTLTAVQSRTPEARTPVGEEELARLADLLTELNAAWRTRLGEPPFDWKIRRAKSHWGCCHWTTRRITYNAELARLPRELVEYVVVHELTHFQAHDHGPRFQDLMDARLPEWKSLRRRLNKRDWKQPSSASKEPPTPVRLVQGEFW